MRFRLSHRHHKQQQQQRGTMGVDHSLPAATTNGGIVSIIVCGEHEEAMKPKAFEDDVSTMATAQSLSTTTTMTGGAGSDDNDNKEQDEDPIPKNNPTTQSSSIRDLKKQNSKSRIHFWKQRSRSLVGDDSGTTTTTTSLSDSVSNNHHPVDTTTTTTGKERRSFWNALEEVLFPKNRLLHLTNDGNNNNNNNNTAVKKNHATKMQPTHKLKPGMVLLEGCDTLEEHYDSIKQRCFAMKDLRSQEGLKAVGLEYRTVFCDEHKPVPEDDNSNDLEDCNDFTNLNAASLRRLTQSSSSLDCNELGNGESAVEDEFPTPTTIASSDDVGSSTAAVDSNDVDALSLSALPPNMLPDGLPNVHLQKEQEEAEDAASIRSTDSIYSENNSSNPLLALQCNNKNDPENQDAEILATALDIRDRCHWCSRRLFYCGNSATRNDANESSTIVEPTLITDENRKRYIADGDMYEQVARLSQEYAQQVMCEEANLQWVTVEDSPERNEPLRFLLSKGHPILQQQGGEEGNQSTNVEQPTLVVCTGRGKVRAGIFSRQHLICGGMELSTAIPMLQEASLRRHHVLVMDPNVHGESLGFVTFQKTLNYYGEQMLLRNSSPSPLYMLSHSASGGHFARYLLDDQPSPQYFLSNLQSVAFTDSTHSVQWAAPPKQKKGQSTTIPWEPHKQALYNFLQSRQCVYFRVGARASRDGVVSSGDWHMHPAGSPAPTDEYWKHRFGTIKTLWAGTNEHSLTNWYPHSQIYGHFDDCLRLLQQQQQQCQETGDTT